jgi:hypothetical protein
MAKYVVDIVGETKSAPRDARISKGANDGAVVVDFQESL